MSRLEGKRLATKAKQCVDKGLGLSATAVECGWFNESKEGNKIPNTNGFQRELLAAVGFDFPTSGKGILGETVSVLGNSSVVLSPTRCKAAGIEPGDELKITYNETDGSFVISKD